ncbi:MULTISPECIES: SGNH/GDSL hydrolase family protein [Streptomyces althioticus group]|uniref:SGNH/GDSL hydrolase family protein n=1 Tax=Streptomyces althioticus group TaxID=2867194 RepID=UPI003518BEA2|nr:SGNH/GDSL hydrolase family protein [Streptomyces althioticus]
MSPAMRRTARTPALRCPAAAAVALGACLTLAAPAPSAGAAPADPVPAVFFGDSYAANYGIAPLDRETVPDALCLRSTENFPAVATRRLADQGVTVDVQADVSCSGARVHHFWEKQELPFAGGEVPPQNEALTHDTLLAVGSTGGNTLGFHDILKQCSAALRGQSVLPGKPVAEGEPAARCAEFFEAGDGRQWLDDRFARVASDLERMLENIRNLSPGAKTVLVGYPRLVPENTAKCLTPAPGQTHLPLADIPQDAMPVLDRIQKRLDDVMRKAAAGGGADFVGLYARTGGNTVCDGADRAIGGLLETSSSTLPWYAHPNEKGRDIQAGTVAERIAEILGRVETRVGRRT